MRLHGAGSDAELPEDCQDSVRQTLQDRLASFRTSGGYAIPGVCLNVVTS